jgi:L-fuculose-phosphate aldolase
MLLEEQRKQVIDIAGQALQSGLIMRTMGNFSMRDPETGYICITPSGMDYSVVEPEDIVVMDMGRIVIDGRRKPSIESGMHCLAYLRRADVYGVCHTHSCFATAWACVEEPFPLILAEMAAVLGGKLETAPFFPMGSEELAGATIQVLGKLNAVLMSNHGQLTVGSTLGKALATAQLVEEAAKVACYAVSIGKPKMIAPEQANLLQQWISKNYGQ